MLSDKIDRMVAIKNSMAALKEEYSGLEAEVLKQSESDLQNTKLKSITYKGSSGTATATMADSLKVTYPTFLKKIFGEAYNDVASEKVNIKLSDPATRLLTAIWKQDFIRTSFDDIMKQIPVDDNTRKLLAKKVKGINFAKDKQNLITIGKLGEEAADQYAYFLSEAAAWDNLIKLLSAGGAEVTEEKISEALSWINSAVIVEETPKITIEGVA